MNNDDNPVEKVMTEIKNVGLFFWSNKLLMLMFLVYSTLLILGSKNIAEHNGRIKQCSEMGMVMLDGYECITEGEYNYRKDIIPNYPSIQNMKFENIGNKNG